MPCHAMPWHRIYERWIHYDASYYIGNLNLHAFSILYMENQSMYPRHQYCFMRASSTHFYLFGLYCCSSLTDFRCFFFWLILIPFVERLDMDMDMDKKRRNEAQARTTERDGEKSKAVSVACNILHHVS